MCWCVRGCLIAAVLHVAAGAVAGDVERAEQKVRKLWSRNRSVMASFSLTIRTKSGSHTVEGDGEGTLNVSIDKRRTLTRWEIDLKLTNAVGEQKQERRHKSLLVFDGDYAWEYIDAPERKSVTRKSADAQADVTTPRLLDSLRRDYEVRLRRDQRVDGRKAYVFEGLARNTLNNRDTRVLHYFDKENGVLLKSVAYGADGRVRRTLRFFDVKLNEEVDPKLFEFTPPSGVPITDHAKPTPVPR